MLSSFNNEWLILSNDSSMIKWAPKAQNLKAENVHSKGHKIFYDPFVCHDEPPQGHKSL